MANLLEDSFPHLDGVVNGLTPAYRADLLFKCVSVRDRGAREALTVDREAEWMVVEGPEFDGAPHFARFRSRVVLRLRVDVKAREDDALMEAHALATGIVTDWLTADRRGVSATTGILAIVPDPEDLVTYSRIEADEGPPLAVVAEIAFILVHGDC